MIRCKMGSRGKVKTVKKEEKIEKMLNELADATAQPVRSGLAEEIKNRIPHRLIPHKGGLDTINIIVDLRISKLTAAAAIIMTIVLCAGFFGDKESTGEGIFHNSMLLVKYLGGWGDTSENSLLIGRSQYELLLERGESVEWYGDSIDPEDSNAVLMHWQLSDDKYGVFFADGREAQVSSEELIQLLAYTLQKKTE